MAFVAAAASQAADWTDANNATYTALKSINGGGNGTTAGGFIITDITPAGTETVKFKVKTPAAVSANGCVYCARSFTKSGSKWSVAATQFTGFRLAAKFRIDRRGTQTSLDDVTCTPNTEYSASADYTTGAVTINNAVQGQSLGTDSYTPGGKLAVLASYSNILAPASPTASSTWGNYLPDDLYYLQLWSAAGALVHNFMPASRDSDSAVGLYDTVTRTFHAAAKNTITGAAYGASERAGKKWTGAGDDNLMSNAANWENNDKPAAGDDVDFTIAAPNAAIVADIGATFGKIYLGTGDLPAFSGTLAATAINDLTRMQAYDTATAGFTFTLAAPVGQDFTWNGGAAANWNTTDSSWLYNNAASVWYDNNNAIFNTAGATATLTENITADSLAFSQPATIAGSSTLTVPTVSVVPNVSAVISAPTAGALEKTGAGTLTLGSSRADATTVTEGTLKMLDGATVTTLSSGAAELTLGTFDPTKPVVFDYGGQTLTATPGSYLVNGSNVTLTNGVFREGGNGDMHIRDDRADSAIPAVLTIANGATLSKYGTSRGALVINAKEFESTINIAGGEVHSGNYAYIQHAAETGTLNINVTEGGRLSIADNLHALCDGTAGASPSLNMMFAGSTFNVGANFHFGNATTAAFPVSPSGMFAARNSAVNVTTGFYIGRNTQDEKTAGFYKADFENCAVTTRYFAVYHDRPLNNARFNGTTLTFSNAGSIAASDGAANWITVGPNGMTFDTQNFSATLNADLGGSGAVTKVGAGMLTVQSNQTASAALNVNEGTLELIAGLSVSRPISVAIGAVLKFQGEASLASLALAADSTNDVAVVSPITLSGGLTLPESGVAALTFNGGAFPVGIYSLFAYTGAAAADGAKFAPDTNGETATWSVINGALTLTVGNPPNTWIGGATGNLSDQSSWSRGTVPGRGETAVVAAGSSATLTVGASFSPDVIIIPEGSADVTFSGEAAITGLAAVTNLSGSVCTFEMPVDFANAINVHQSAYYYCNSSSDAVRVDGGHVRFAGGVMGTGFAEGTTRRLDGAYTIPATAGWVANNWEEELWTLPEATEAGGSSLTITGSSYEVPGTTDTSMLLLGTGCAFTTGVVRTSNRLSYRIYGEYVVTNELEVAMTGDTYIAQKFAGTYKFEKLTLSDNGTGWNFYVANSTRANDTKNLYIGAGGINVTGTASTSTALVLGFDNKTSHDVTHLHPWHGDYAINGKGGSTRDLLIYRTTYLHTDDENGVARTVTLNGIADVRAALTINGSGRFQVNSNGMNGENPPRIGTVTVTDSATLAYSSGADLGAGAVTVGANSTMEVASGVNTFDGGLTLNDGATLAFNFTDRATSPVLAVAAGTTFAANGAVTVKVSGVRPKGGEKILTSCGGFDAAGVSVSLAADAPKWVKGLSVNSDGNLVLDVKRGGLTVFVR